MHCTRTVCTCTCAWTCACACHAHVVHCTCIAHAQVQLKPAKWAADGTPTEALFILKWGGELTSLGEAQAQSCGSRTCMHMHMHMACMCMCMCMCMCPCPCPCVCMHVHACAAQAESLGSLFRNSLFPAEGGGFLRLHSTYRHDLEVEQRRLATCGCSLRCCLRLQPLPPMVAGTTSRSTHRTRAACR